MLCCAYSAYLLIDTPLQIHNHLGNRINLGDSGGAAALLSWRLCAPHTGAERPCFQVGIVVRGQLKVTEVQKDNAAIMTLR